MARFASEQTSQTGAINTLADADEVNTHGSIYDKSDGAETLTAAEFVNGIVNQSGTPGSFNLATPTAEDIVAHIPNCQVGSRFEFAIINGGDGTVTLTAGDGVTLTGAVAPPTGFTQIFRGVVTNATAGSEAVEVVGLLTSAQLADAIS